MKLKNFEVRFEPLHDGAFPISVSSPAGRGRGHFRIPSIDTAPAATALPTRDLTVTSEASTKASPNLGSALFRSFFTGQVRSLFDRSMGAIEGEESVGLRLKLCFDPEIEGQRSLLELPWERLYWRERREFLSLNPRIPIVRSLAIPRRRPCLRTKPPLRMLIAAANPRGTQPLKWQADNHKIIRALKSTADIEYEPMNGATVAGLGARLRDDDLHILHFVGHGTFDEKQGRGALLLESTSGDPVTLDGETLADLCRSAPSLRLVVLSACHTARTTRHEDREAFAGVTSSLLMAGLPAVLAMAGPISDHAAIAFNESFYTSLAKGRPLERATLAGRLAIRSHDAAATEWATPVLTTDAEDGQLFDLGSRSHQSGVFALPAEGESKVARPPQSFSWLHLSDLHLGARSPYETKIALSSLLEDLRTQVERSQRRPDACFITGDIAFSGQPSQYETAESFLHDLLETLDVGSERLFLVPGNHDVDWNRISMTMRSIGRGLTDRESVVEVLADAQARSMLLSRLKAYTEHVDRLGGAWGRDGESLGYHGEIRLGSWRVSILGLNSAWLSEQGDDNGRLLLGERQVRDLLDDSQSADLRIALVHHPLELLHEFDRNDCEALLSRGCDFILHGHLHRASIQQLETPDSGAVTIAGGATWEARAAVNAYNLVTLDLAAGLGEIQLRRFSDHGGGFWAPDTLRFRNAPQGFLSFRFRQEETSPDTPEKDSTHISGRGSSSIPPNGEPPRGFTDDLKWYNLVRHIQRGMCTPILGAGLSESLLDSRRDVARLWASKHRYPLGPHEQVDLPQVAQYLAVHEGEPFMRAELADFLRHQLSSRYAAGRSANDAAEESLDDLICSIGERKLSPALKALARLPFPLYVTADTTSLLQRALERTGKEPRVEIKPWQETFPEPETVFEREPDYQPTTDTPLLYHLSGHLSRPESLVLTEDNYFDFLISHAESQAALPGPIKRPLADSALLFLGFELHAWDFRVLFRSLVRQEGRSQREQYPHVAVQLDPLGSQVLDEQRSRSYLEQYFYKNAAISIYWGDVNAFLRELWQRWETDQ